MERLVSDLLRLARLDARQEALDLAPCDLQQLFNTVIGDVAQTAEAKRQRITTAVDPAAGRITADPAKLHDVLRNLVENAVHYAPDAATINLDATHANGTVRISVSDSGPGIPPHDLSRVFERFYRVDKSRSRRAARFARLDPQGRGARVRALGDDVLRRRPDVADRTRQHRVASSLEPLPHDERGGGARVRELR